MTLYDIAMISLLVIGLAQGAWRGMVGQIAPIASLLLGYAIAFPLSLIAAPYFGAGPTGRMIAMLVLYLIVSFGVYMIVRSIRDTLEKYKLQDFDRHMGTLLGGVKGLLFALTITFFAVTLSPTARAAILPTYAGFTAAVVMDRLHPIMPEHVHELLEPYIHSLDDTLAPHGYHPIADEHHHESPSAQPAPSWTPEIVPFGPPAPPTQSLLNSTEDVGQAIEGYLESRFLGTARRVASSVEEARE
jgi:membrane protein required for colicin V production